MPSRAVFDQSPSVQAGMSPTASTRSCNGTGHRPGYTTNSRSSFKSDNAECMERVMAGALVRLNSNRSCGCRRTPADPILPPGALPSNSIGPSRLRGCAPSPASRILPGSPRFWVSHEGGLRVHAQQRMQYPGVGEVDLGALTCRFFRFSYQGCSRRTISASTSASKYALMVRAVTPRARPSRNCSTGCHGSGPAWSRTGAS